MEAQKRLSLLGDFMAPVEPHACMIRYCSVFIGCSTRQGETTARSMPTGRACLCRRHSRHSSRCKHYTLCPSGCRFMHWQHAEPRRCNRILYPTYMCQRRPATELTLFISPVSIQMTAPVSWRADSWNGRIGAASHGCSAATASLTSSVLLVLRTTMQQRFRQTCIHASMLLTSQPLQAGSIAGHQAESLNADHNLCMASNCQQAGQVPIACVPSAPAISSWSSLLLSMSSSPQPAQVTGHLALL